MLYCLFSVALGTKLLNLLNANINAVTDLSSVGIATSLKAGF